MLYETYYDEINVELCEIARKEQEEALHIVPARKHIGSGEDQYTLLFLSSYQEIPSGN